MLRPSFKRLSFLALTVVLLSAALFIGRQKFLAPYIKEMVIEQARSQLGLDLTIGQVNGTYFSSLELTGIRTVSTTPPPPLVALDIGRLTIHYSLLSLLAGSDPFVAVSRITLDNASVKLDISQNGTPGVGIPLLTRLPRLTVRDSSIHIRTAEETIELNGLTVHTTTHRNGADAQKVALAVARAILPFPGIVHRPLPIGLRLLYSHESITVESLAIDHEQVLQSAFLDLRDARNERFPFAADLLLFQGTSRLQGMLDNSRISGQLSLRNINLGALPGFLEKPEFAVGGLVNGQIDLALDFADIAEPTAALNLEIQKGRVRQITVPQLDLQASAANGLFRLQQLQAKSGETFISLHDVAVPGRSWPGMPQVIRPS